MSGLIVKYGDIGGGEVNEYLKAKPLIVGINPFSEHHEKYLKVCVSDLPVS